MNSNIRFLLLILIIFSAFVSCKSTKQLSKAEQATQSEAMTIEFPYDALGYWEGKLKIYQGSEMVQEVPMAMDIFEIGESKEYAWQIIYNPGKDEDKRKYLLLEIDKEKGHYHIDEDNGIVLDTYLIGNKLISSFSVSESTLTTTHTFLKDQIVFEVIAGPQESISTTGNMKVEGETIPPVDSYQISTYQRAVLKRIRG